ncbi:hypothetical protein AB0I28_01810 [Phytomonospora sp. NPDC050363]|uniref:hypothetical protein n=1 Tax=Phytomonospora sp. NPDC050363 TaxID=3155642 RepID=UPI0033D5EABD
MSDTPGPVTSDDVRVAVASCSSALGGALDADWSVPADGLTWSCWDTAEHLADDLFAYAAQFGPARPPLDGHVPFTCVSKTPGGPAASVFADPQAGPAGLVQVIETCGTFLAAVVATTPPEARAFHGLGIADPEGFAAMGIVEAVVHTGDIARALGLEFEPPAEVCARVLYRLFPDAPADGEPWPTLLWATGRGELPGRARLDSWRWHCEPRA